MKMKIKFKRLAKKLAILSSLLTVTLVIGHGCSQFNASSGSGSSSSTGLGCTGDCGSTPPGGSVPPIANALTVSILYNKLMLDNLVTCAGIGAPSALTQDEYNKRQASLSEYGASTDVTAPMLMGITALAGEICNDVINQEAAQNPADRRFFNAVDFTLGLNGQSAGSMGEVVRRVARGCWAREETVEELGDIATAIDQANTADAVDTTNPKQTRNMALMVCTGMLSSLSAIVQ